MERCFSAFLTTFLLFNCVWTLPVEKLKNKTENVNSSSEAPHDLYIIRTIVYEIGILTDASNDTGYSNETHEQVDLTFYNPEYNDTVIDLSNIPIPIQTNISGQIITGIAPADFGLIPLPPGAMEDNHTKFTLNGPLFPHVILSQTTNVSTSDPEEEKRIIEGLPDEVGI